MAGGGDSYSPSFTTEAYPTFNGSGLPTDECPLEIFIKDTEARWDKADLVDLETLAMDEALGSLTLIDNQ